MENSLLYVNQQEWKKIWFFFFGLDFQNLVLNTYYIKTFCKNLILAITFHILKKNICRYLTQIKVRYKKYLIKKKLLRFWNEEKFFLYAPKINNKVFFFEFFFVRLINLIFLALYWDFSAHIYRYTYFKIYILL